MFREVSLILQWYWTEQTIRYREVSLIQRFWLYRDKMMEAHVSEKLVAAQREMEKLQAEERRVERSLEIKSERKKLRIF
jgi:hypothetical protein